LRPAPREWRRGLRGIRRRHDPDDHGPAHGSGRDRRHHLDAAPGSVAAAGVQGCADRTRQPGVAARSHQASHCTARRKAGSFAVLLVDLDRFKPVNDIYGHATGDLVLRKTARRLQAATRAVDTVARLGGDEFVVLLGGASGRDEARLVVERIIQAITAPLAVHELRLGVSVGIALYPDDGSDAEQLLARADGAMYDAKHRGGNRHAFAENAGIGERIGARLALSPKYMIGIEPVDKQHDELVSRMNNLWEALLARQDHAALSRGLTEMTRLLEEHFAIEEAQMTAYPYAGAAAHRADHERALQTARSLAAHVDEQSLALGIRFLYDWLLSHIRSYDAELPRGVVG